MTIFFCPLLPSLWESVGLFAGSEASYSCRSDEIRLNKNMFMKQLWNDTEKGNCKYRKKTSSQRRLSLSSCKF